MVKKRLAKKKLIIEGIIALLLAISPLLFYSYKYIPINSENTWSVLGITFSDNGYDDITVAFYFYLSKLIPLALLIIWFLTSKNWWYHVILIPIAMYAFQLYNVFSEDAQKIDENEILYLLIVCMVIIPIVYFIRLKLFDKYVHGIDLEAMEAELQSLKEKHGSKETKITKTDSQKQPRSQKLPRNKSPREYQTLTEKIETKLSTNNIESHLRQFQNQLGDWLHFR